MVNPNQYLKTRFIKKRKIKRVRKIKKIKKKRNKSLSLKRKIKKSQIWLRSEYINKFIIQYIKKLILFIIIYPVIRKPQFRFGHKILFTESKTIEGLIMSLMKVFKCSSTWKHHNHRSYFVLGKFPSQRYTVNHISSKVSLYPKQKLCIL